MMNNIHLPLIQIGTQGNIYSGGIFFILIKQQRNMYYILQRFLFCETKLQEILHVALNSNINFLVSK